MNVVMVILFVCAFFIPWAQTAVLVVAGLKILVELIALLITIRGFMRVGGASFLLRSWRGSITALRYSSPLLGYFVIGVLLTCGMIVLAILQGVRGDAFSIANSWWIAAILALGLTLALHVSTPTALLLLADSSPVSLRLHRYLDHHLHPPFRTVSLLNTRVLGATSERPREDSRVAAHIYRTDRDDWKDLVSFFADRAGIIVVDMRSVSENTSWEVDYLQKHGLNYKTIYFVPKRRT